MKLFPLNRVHFIGIGGIGMSAIAEMLPSMGVQVQGSNDQENANTRRLQKMGIPVFIGHLFQQLYNTADSVIVGYYVGDNALAAVGSASPILNLLLALFVGISTGAGIVVSQYYGAGAREKLSRAVGNCITLGFIATVATMVIGVLIARPMLTLLDTPVTIYEWCADYLTLYFLGAIGFTFYNILSGILRGLGDSVSALLFLLVSAGLNIVLDIWFVAGLHMGVPGVALATVIAQGISAVLCLLKLMRMRSVFDLTFPMLSLRKDVALRIVKLGLPSGITQAIFSMSAISGFNWFRNCRAGSFPFFCIKCGEVAFLVKE